MSLQIGTGNNEKVGRLQIKSFIASFPLLKAILSCTILILKNQTFHL